MAGSKGAAKAAKAAQDDSEQEPLKIQNLGDMAQIKRVLDETAVAAVLDMGYDERHLVTDSKIALGLLAVGLALTAQFYPAPYPENKTVLALCIAGYCALNLALQYITSFVENGVVLFTKPNPGAGKAAVAARGLAVRVTMKRFAETCDVSVMRADARRADHPDTVTETLRVCEFIYEDGVVAEDKFRNAVEALVERFERGGEGNKAR